MTTIVPVLLLVFKRPEMTRVVMDAIREARPARLYIAADGPRDRSGEAALCRETRRVATEVDWPCDVRTLFRDSNLGCRVAVSEALDWIFKYEEEAIVLEDDCVPTKSFFPYCEELLARYHNDTRVMSISGNNFQRSKITSDSYCFSIYMHCWGWATWRRAWYLYDRNMSAWPGFKARRGLHQFAAGRQEFEDYWGAIFDAAAENRIDSWAYRFLFSCWLNNGLAIAPRVNLVSNIGFGADATHTNHELSPLGNIATAELEFPLTHPGEIAQNLEADAYETEHVYRIKRVSRIAKWRRRLRLRARLRNVLHLAVSGKSA